MAKPWVNFLKRMTPHTEFYYTTLLRVIIHRQQIDTNPFLQIKQWGVFRPCVTGEEGNSQAPPTALTYVKIQIPQGTLTFI